MSVLSTLPHAIDSVNSLLRSFLNNTTRPDGIRHIVRCYGETSDPFLTSPSFIARSNYNGGKGDVKSVEICLATGDISIIYSLLRFAAKMCTIRREKF